MQVVRSVLSLMHAVQHREVQLKAPHLVIVKSRCCS